MELEHRFEVPIGIERAWDLLTDMEQVGPCFPGASLDKVEGNEFSGAVKIKLGPITMVYKGDAKFVEKDPVAHRARIEAMGSAARTSSTAAMMVTATATSLAPNRTAVDMVTTLSITGRPAQFGRGVMVEVGNKLIGQFADCVSNKLIGKDAGNVQLVDVTDPDQVAAEVVADERETVEAAGAQEGTTQQGSPQGTTAAAAPTVVPRAGQAPATRPPAQAQPANEPINLVDTAATPILKRLIPVLAGVIGLILLRKIFKRKHKGAERSDAKDAVDTVDHTDSSDPSDSAPDDPRT